MTFYYLKVVKSKNLEFGILWFWAGKLVTFTTDIGIWFTARVDTVCQVSWNVFLKK